MHDADGLDLMGTVFAQSFFKHIGIDALSPSSGDELRAKPQLFCELFPKRCEMAGLDHQNLVSWGQGIDQGGLPGAGSRPRIDDHWLLCAEYGLDLLEYLKPEPLKFWPSVVDGREVDRPENSVRDIRRTRDL